MPLKSQRYSTVGSYLPGPIVIANLRARRRRIPRIISASTCEEGGEVGSIGPFAETVTETGVAGYTAGTDFGFRIANEIVGNFNSVRVVAYPSIWRCYNNQGNPEENQRNNE